MNLSNAILHNSATGANHTRAHVRYYSVRLLVAHWVVIGQYSVFLMLCVLHVYYVKSILIVLCTPDMGQQIYGS